MKPFLRDAATVVLIAGVGVAMLIPEQRAFLRPWPWDGLPAVLPYTAWTALKVWLFWAAGALVLGGLARRVEPELDGVDAAIAGFIGVWIFAYVGGNLLGPIGLFRTA